MDDRTEEETVPVLMETSSFSQVVFNDVPPAYPPNSAVTCRYTLTGDLQPNPRDWVGIYKVGWTSTQQYYNYVWTEPSLDHLEQLVHQVVFKESYLPKDDGEFYQFCYVDSIGHIRGASTPFCFQNPAESSLDSSLEKDLLVITTQEQAEKMEKEKEDYVKEIESIKEHNTILRKELDERLLEIRRLRSTLDDLKSKDKPEIPLQEEQCHNATEESLTSHHEKYDSALQKITSLKTERSILRQQVEHLEAEILQLNTLLKETEQNYSKVQDQVKLLQVDVQSSRKDYEKLANEIQELRMKKTLEERRAENKALQTSMTERGAHGGDEENHKIQIQALLSQLTEARGLLRNEVQSCKEAYKRAEGAEQELREVKKKLEEVTLKQAESEKNDQIQAQLEQAQDKIYEMAETSRLDREKLVKRNEEMQTEINKLQRALFDYEVASVAAMANQIPSTQSPPASHEYTYPPDSHFYENIDELTANPAQTDTQTRVCRHCQEGFPGISEDELAQHEESHKVCPFCTLLCDNLQQQEFEDHVYGHED